ncbi:MAG: sodium/solute symporter [Pseudomonadota bacterium]
MNRLDYFVVGLYLFGLLLFGFALRKQSSDSDYFLGGRSIGWFPLTLSTMATQLSAISFVSAPAFVGLREDGGLKWLTYELAMPLAMILVMFVIAPALYRAGVVSIYSFLERRFDRTTRLLVSAAFQVVRAFSTGIMVYAMGLILQAVLDFPLWQSIVFVGLITLVYSTTGGMKAVVYGDAVQMGLIFFGLLVVGAYALGEVGGWSMFWQHVDARRFTTLDYDAIGFDSDPFGFWPMLFGGIVLYASYYGCDQTQAQRLMSARSPADTRRLLFADGALRFPLVLLYCLVGLLVGVVVTSNPELMSAIPGDRPDYMMPVFIINVLPHGVIGLLLVAIMAAAMSSLSSAINSLAAVTLEDLESLGLAPRSKQSEVTWARIVSLSWGVVILVMSTYAGSIAPTVIEAINKVGSAMYGPVLAVFLLGIVGPRVTGRGASVGLLAGLGVNVYLWRAQPQVFWMWWNVIGFTVTCTIALATRTRRVRRAPADNERPRSIVVQVMQSPYAWGLALIFVVTMTVATFVQGAHTWFAQAALAT